jgi:hypothetical protein
MAQPNELRKTKSWGRSLRVRAKSSDESAVNECQDSTQDFAVWSALMQDRISLSSSGANQVNEAALSMRDRASASTSADRHCSDFSR